MDEHVPLIAEPDGMTEPDGVNSPSLFLSYPEAMSVDQVSEALGVCANTVRAMIYQHQIPAKKVGAKWRVLRTELCRWAMDADN
jgi:excisionase family DNA binding protein